MLLGFLAYEYLIVLEPSVDKIIPSPLELPWQPCQNSIDHTCMALFLDLILFHWSENLLHTVSVNLAIIYSKSWNEVVWVLQLLFSLLKLLLGFLGPLYIHTNFGINLSISTKTPDGILTRIMLNVWISFRVLTTRSLWSMSVGLLCYLGLL